MALVQRPVDLKNILFIKKYDLDNIMKIIKKIDGFLNGITMYRTVLYSLLLMLAAALAFSAFGLMPFNPLALILSTGFILAVSVLSNAVFAWAFNAPSNIESVYITALILALIITPVDGLVNIVFLSWVSVLAMASKYILAIGKKHLFNPVAISLVIVSLATAQAASWWVANLFMMPFVVISGLLLVRKLKRFDLVLAFLTVMLATSSIFSLINGQDLLSGLQRALVYSPMLFFAFIMLTEPMTVPPGRLTRILYGAIVGFLFAPQIHIGSFYLSPELVLLMGNVFAYIVSPDNKLILTLNKKEEIASNIYNFEFEPDRKLSFKPGQYMEFTLEHPSQDSRGIRRFLTIASSPTEEKLDLGIKFYDRPSSFKKYLMAAGTGHKMVASQLAGDFTLPEDKNKKLVFIAGGIGITPFRSMIKYLLDRSEKRDIVLFYSNWTCDDISYKEIFDEAEKKLDIKVVYSIVNDPSVVPDNHIRCGLLNERDIIEEVPDYRERLFFISGPPSMVNTFVASLKKIGVGKNNIKTDYFPGFA